MRLSFFKILYSGRGLTGEDVTYDMGTLKGLGGKKQTNKPRNPQGGSEKPRMTPAGADTQVGQSRNTS